jgi:hypothetical protein
MGEGKGRGVASLRQFNAASDVFRSRNDELQFSLHLNDFLTENGHFSGNALSASSRDGRFGSMLIELRSSYSCLLEFF